MEANCPPFTGSAAEYDQDHYSRYGEAEGMVDGKHVNKDGTLDTRPRFPQGSHRSQAHDSYKASTRARNKSFTGYMATRERYDAEFNEISDEEKKEYFKHTTGGLLPSQHEHLATRAEVWDEHSYK